MIVTQNDETRDNEIAAIFNPKRVRTPSVVVTNESPNNGPSQLANNANTNQIVHSDSVTSSQPDGAESLTGVIIGDHITDHSHQQTHALIQSHSHQLPRSASAEHEEKAKGCRGSCCSELAQKMYIGIVVTILITFFWVGATHCFYFLYASPKLHESLLKALGLSHLTPMLTLDVDSSAITRTTNDTIKNTKMSSTEEDAINKFRAPFIASWFSTNFLIIFFPAYLIFRGIARKCGANTETFGDIVRGFRERGYTFGRYFYRCISFCLLWVGSTYLYMKSLRVLNATEVIVLFATNVASVYLLSWVILHEQFVGIRIVAVILVDTGIALLAYKDGINDSKTLASVVFSTIAGAGYAVFRVMFRKMIGIEQLIGSIALSFTVIGLINATLLWPVCLILYLTGLEVVPFITLLIITLLVGCVFLLLFHILTQFSGAVTYNMFITLGLITSVPFSAALDIVLYGAEFAGMKLGGMILITVGFFLVMLPNNWPEYITRLLRNLILIGHTARWNARRNESQFYSGPTDYRTGYIRSHLRSPSGRVR